MFLFINFTTKFQIVCLIRDLKDPQKFQIIYENGDERAYTSNER